MTNRHSRNWSVILSIGRIAGIVIGIAAMLRLATNTGLVEYNTLFQEWMDRLRDIVELGFLVDLLESWIVVPFFNALRGFGFNVPPIQPHWQSAWVLSWLFLWSFSRHTFENSSLVTFMSVVLWAGACSLIGAALSGTIAPSSTMNNMLIYYCSIIGILIFPLGLSFVTNSDVSFREALCNFFKGLAPISLPMIVFILARGNPNLIVDPILLMLSSVLGILFAVLIVTIRDKYILKTRALATNRGFLITGDIFAVVLFSFGIAYFFSV